MRDGPTALLAAICRGKARSWRSASRIWLWENCDLGLRYCLANVGGFTEDRVGCGSLGAASPVEDVGQHPAKQQNGGGVKNPEHENDEPAEDSEEKADRE